MPGAKVINLRAARKSAARDAARKQGDANAAKFGRSKAGRLTDEAETRRKDRLLDGHRIEAPQSASDDDA